MIRSASLALALVLSSGAVAHAQELPRAPATSRAVDVGTLVWPAASPAGALDHPLLLRGHDMGLISLGIVGLSVGMAVGIAIASFDLGTRGNCTDFSSSSGFVFMRVQCGTAPFALIPFAGSVIVGSVGLHGTVDSGALLAGNLALVPQILGIVFLLMGVHGFTEDLVSDPSGLTVRLDPIASPSQLGATLSVSL